MYTERDLGRSVWLEYPKGSGRYREGTIYNIWPQGYITVRMNFQHEQYFWDMTPAYLRKHGRSFEWDFEGPYKENLTEPFLPEGEPSGTNTPQS